MSESIPSDKSSWKENLRAEEYIRLLKNKGLFGSVTEESSDFDILTDMPAKEPASTQSPPDGKSPRRRKIEIVAPSSIEKSSEEKEWERPGLKKSAKLLLALKGEKIKILSGSSAKSESLGKENFTAVYLPDHLALVLIDDDKNGPTFAVFDVSEEKAREVAGFSQQEIILDRRGYSHIKLNLSINKGDEENEKTNKHIADILFHIFENKEGRKPAREVDDDSGRKMLDLLQKEESAPNKSENGAPVQWFDIDQLLDRCRMYRWIYPAPIFLKNKKLDDILEEYFEKSIVDILQTLLRERESLTPEERANLAIERGYGLFSNPQADLSLRKMLVFNDTLASKLDEFIAKKVAEEDATAVTDEKEVSELSEYLRSRYGNKSLTLFKKFEKEIRNRIATIADPMERQREEQKYFVIRKSKDKQHYRKGEERFYGRKKMLLYTVEFIRELVKRIIEKK